MDRHRLDPHLFQFFRAHQAISNASSYADHIDRTLHTLYIKDNIAHIVLDVCTTENIPANKLIKFMSGMLHHLEEITGDPNASNDIDVKLNVQSPGILEFIGPPLKVAVLAIILIMLVGGDISFSKQGDDFNFSIQTDGLIEKSIQVYERVFKDSIDTKSLKSEIEQLKIKDPTKLPQV